MTDLRLADAMLVQIKKDFKPGDSITVDDVKFERGTRHSRQTALWQLSQKGYLDKPRGRGTKGRYVLRGRKAPNGKTTVKLPRKKVTPKVSPVQALYDLLEFMAKAEAPLRRAAKILEAVEGA